MVDQIPSFTPKSISAPSGPYLTFYMIVLSTAALIWTIWSRLLPHGSLTEGIKKIGVPIKRVGKALRELERKAFHLCGLLVPLIYQILLQFERSQSFCAGICWAVTVAGVTLDIIRLKVPFVRDNFPLRGMLRSHEVNNLSGGTYFSMGCTLTISVFPPAIAMASILFLVLGDMSAALVGVSFGGEKCNVKVGTEGKKSMEGSVAMFVVCCIVGLSVFANVHLREYPVVVGSLVATLVELYPPFGIDDNLTIPTFSGMALWWGFLRIQNCERETPLDWLMESNIAR